MYACIYACMYVCMYKPSQNFFLSGMQAGDSNRQQRPSLVLNRSLTNMKLVADISLLVAKLSAAAHFDWADCV